MISGGCVQEEIKFSVNPELTVSLLFCPVMLADEAVVIVGTEHMSESSVGCVRVPCCAMQSCGLDHLRRQPETAPDARCLRGTCGN